MIIKKMLVGFALAFVAIFVVVAFVTYLWNLIAYGEGTFEWATSFRLGIILTVLLGIALPLIGNVSQREKRNRI
jgi:hypothetical protein